MITTVCSGWPDVTGRRVHTETRVLVQGAADRPVSHGICIPCRDAYIERIHAQQQHAARMAAKDKKGRRRR